jgi:hypothetical protein
MKTKYGKRKCVLNMPRKWIVRMYVGHRLVSKIGVYADNEAEAHRVALLHVSNHPDLKNDRFKWDMKLSKEKIKKVS